MRLERAFRSVMGITPRQYADSQRMRRLKSQLRKGDDVTTALYDAGFGSSSRLYERAPSQLGMTPATYRHGGAGMRVNYTIVDSPLGRLLVGATVRGISAVYLGKSDGRLEGALKKEYPRAEIRRDRNGLEGWVSEILEHLRGREPNLDLPTDVQATAFQRRVWEELRRIPYGTTRTYSQVARAIGQPAAVRAVARACATNPSLGGSAVPSGGAGRWQTCRLPLGAGAEAGAAGTRICGRGGKESTSSASMSGSR